MHRGIFGSFSRRTSWQRRGGVGSRGFRPALKYLGIVILAALLMGASSTLFVPRAAAATPDAAPQDAAGTYVVRAGRYAQQHRGAVRVTPGALARANGISNPNRIYIGQRLVVPGNVTPSPQPPTTQPPSGGGTYIVQAGDTLAKIAARHGTTVAALMAANGISNPNLIWVGQRLAVKGGSAPAPKPPVAGGSGKWIDVNLRAQRLTAYEGSKAVFSTLISGGRPGTPTVVGRFAIYTKLVSTRMSGPGYDLPNVPYTMYFYRGYGIHGTYWHNNFGHPMSHGCVNMRTSDAAWLFNWARIGTPVVTHW